MKESVPEAEEIYITSSVEVRLAVIENTLQNINETLRYIKSDLSSIRSDIKSDIEDLRLEIKSDMSELRLELKSDMSELRSELKADNKALSNRLWYLYTAIGTSFFVLLGVMAKAVKWIGS